MMLPLLLKYADAFAYRVSSYDAQTPGASVHWYGKAGISVNRKVGHITIVAPDRATCRQRLAMVDPAAAAALQEASPYAAAPLPSISQAPSSQGGYQSGCESSTDTAHEGSRRAAHTPSDASLQLALHRDSLHRDEPHVPPVPQHATSACSSDSSKAQAPPVSSSGSSGQPSFPGSISLAQSGSAGELTPPQSLPSTDGWTSKQPSISRQGTGNRLWYTLPTTHSHPAGAALPGQPG